MEHKLVRVATRRHRNGVTVHVTQHPHVTGFTVLGEAEGGTELLGHATDLEDAHALADEASGCPQPCSCNPWAAEVNILQAAAPRTSSTEESRELPLGRYMDAASTPPARARILYRGNQTRTPQREDEAPRTIRPPA